MKVDDNYQFKMDGKDELKRHEDKGEMGNLSSGLSDSRSWVIVMSFQGSAPP